MPTHNPLSDGRLRAARRWALHGSVFLLLAGPLLGLADLPVRAESDHSRSDHCKSYASNRARQYSSAGVVLGRTARGAVNGTVMGAIFGGRGSVGRGASIGAGMGLIGGGIAAGNHHNSRYHHYYQACMRGDRY